MPLDARGALTPLEYFGGPPPIRPSKIVETRVDGVLTSIEVVLSHDWSAGAPYLDSEVSVYLPAKALAFGQWLVQAWDNRGGEPVQPNT